MPESPRDKQSSTRLLAVEGHLIEEIYRRYAIVDEEMQRESAGKLNQLHQADLNLLTRDKVGAKS